MSANCRGRRRSRARHRSLERDRDPRRRSRGELRFHGHVAVRVGTADSARRPRGYARPPRRAPAPTPTRCGSAGTAGRPRIRRRPMPSWASGAGSSRRQRPPSACRASSTAPSIATTPTTTWSPTWPTVHARPRETGRSSAAGSSRPPSTTALRSPPTTWRTRTGSGPRPTGSRSANLKEVRVVDPRTVDFALSAVDATFMTEVLPTVPIFSQRDVEARAADFTAATTGLSKEDLVALADSIDEELGRDPPVCTTRLEEMDALFAKLGARLYREDFPAADGTFDACAFMQTASYLVRWNVAEGLGSAGYDAAMAALVGFAVVPATRRHGTVPARVGVRGQGPPRGLGRLPRRPGGDEVHRLRTDEGGRFRPRGRHGRHPPVVLRRQCLPAVGGLARRRGRDPANARVHRALLQRPGRAALRRAKPPAGAPAVHRPAAGRRRGDRRQRDAGLRAGPPGELGRRSQPAEAAAGHGGREAAHRGSRLDAWDGRRLREGRRPPGRRHRDAGWEG